MNWNSFQYEYVAQGPFLRDFLGQGLTFINVLLMFVHYFERNYERAFDAPKKLRNVHDIDVVHDSGCILRRIIIATASISASPCL